MPSFYSMKQENLCCTWHRGNNKALDFFLVHHSYFIYLVEAKGEYGAIILMKSSDEVMKAY